MARSAHVGAFLRFLRDVAGWTFVSVIAGLFGGAFVYLLEWVLQTGAALREALPPHLVWLAPAGGGLAVGLVFWRLGPEAEGEPMPHYIYAVNRSGGRIPFRAGVAALLGASVTLGSGLSGGFTGPAVVASACLAGALAGRTQGLLRLLNMERDGRNLFAVCAAAAAIAGILRAPIGAGIMAVELLYRRNIEYERLFSAILASVSGYLVYAGLSGWPRPLFASPEAGLPSIQLLPWVLALIVAVEGISRLFIATYRRTFTFLSGRGWPAPVRLTLGGLAVGLFALLLMEAHPAAGRELMGTSRLYLFEVLGLERAPGLDAAVPTAAWVVGLFILAKVLATSITVGSGNVAGFVLPTLIIGGFAGHVAAQLGGWTEQATAHMALVATGIAAAMSTTLNVPLAAIVIVAELFGLPFTWVAVLGSLLAYKLSPDLAVYQLGLKTSSILVVEDDASFRRLLIDFLQKNGFVVSGVGDGNAAWEALQRESYDLLLLDRNLPGRSGDDVLREVRADAKLQDLPVVLMTAMTRAQERVDGLELGADDYISKPFHMPELVARVRRLLERARRTNLAILRR